MLCNAVGCQSSRKIALRRCMVQHISITRGGWVSHFQKKSVRPICNTRMAPNGNGWGQHFQKLQASILTITHQIVYIGEKSGGV